MGLLGLTTRETHPAKPATENSNGQFKSSNLRPEHVMGETFPSALPVWLQKMTWVHLTPGVTQTVMAHDETALALCVGIVYMLFSFNYHFYTSGASVDMTEPSSFVDWGPMASSLP